MNSIAGLAADYGLTVGVALLVAARVLRRHRLAPWGAALSAAGVCVLAVLGAAARHWMWTWVCVVIVAGHLALLASAAGRRDTRP